MAELRHLLLVKTKPDVKTQEIDLARHAFHQATAKFTGLISVEWGLNNSPEGKDNGYNLCILMTFVDEAARDAYLPHPEHDLLKIDFAPIIDDIIVVDFYGHPA